MQGDLPLPDGFLEAPFLQIHVAEMVVDGRVA
jgi:hypothetical protein